MTDQATLRTPRPRPKRGEGQWALGYREPLNANEQSKKDDDPLNVRARIEDIYSKRGFASIDPSDLRGRFRWWGSTPSGRRASTAARPRPLDPARARRRVLHDARALATAPCSSADAAAHPRQHLHRLRPRHRRRHRPAEHPVPLDPRSRTCPRSGSASRPSASSTQEACGDSPRPFLGSPVAGIAADEIIDGSSGAGGDQAPLHRQPGVLQPAPQVQDRADRAPEPRRVPRDQRRLLRRHGPPRARPRLRPVGRRRPLHQPDARAEARRVDRRSRRSPTSGRASSRSSATTATAGCGRGRG